MCRRFSAPRSIPNPTQAERADDPRPDSFRMARLLLGNSGGSRRDAYILANSGPKSTGEESRNRGVKESRRGHFRLKIADVKSQNGGGEWSSDQGIKGSSGGHSIPLSLYPFVPCGRVAERDTETSQKLEAKSQEPKRRKERDSRNQGVKEPSGGEAHGDKSKARSQKPRGKTALTRPPPRLE